jgi:hypothetical protein
MRYPTRFPSRCSKASCRHMWMALSAHPKQCPKCHKLSPTVRTRRGRPAKYPWVGIEVGERRIYLFGDSLASRHTALQAMRAYVWRTRRSFDFWTSVQEMLIVRVADPTPPSRGLARHRGGRGGMAVPGVAGMPRDVEML